ncbi:MAG: ZIP family metal transporter [Planctomycetota bacterium]
MNVLPLLAIYCALILAASLFGGRISSLIRMTHLRTQLLMSGVGGLMLGIAMLHLFPHSCELLGASKAGIGGLVGLTGMFLLIRLFHTHDHSGNHGHDHGAGHRHDDGASHRSEHSEIAHHAHEPDGEAWGHSDHAHERGLGWAGLFFGLVLHTIIDGVALAASVIAESEHGAWLSLAGLGTFLAVALHKPLDAFAITAVMQRQHWSSRAQWLVNVGFSLACPVGAFAFYFGVSNVVTDPTALGWGLALSAGFFIGIALADLLPEVAFHDHDSGKLTATFLLGIAIAIGVENLPGHNHSHEHPAASDRARREAIGHDHSQGHDHSGHDHPSEHAH